MMLMREDMIPPCEVTDIPEKTILASFASEERACMMCCASFDLKKRAAHFRMRSMRRSDVHSASAASGRGALARAWHGAMHPRSGARLPHETDPHGRALRAGRQYRHHRPRVRAEDGRSPRP